ncbi:MAG: divergent polysaccharide deacetylase family protein [Spirochaetes bacterium]|nr:divergent polysaccharide deacetylase family protein [Spirochaetota bacterium]
MKKKKQTKHFHLIFLANLVLAVSVVIFILFHFNAIKALKFNNKNRFLKQALWQLKENEMAYLARDDLSEIRVVLASRQEFKEFLKGIQVISDEYGYELKEYPISRENTDIQVSISIVDRDRTITTFHIVRQLKGHLAQIAIIIDDAGYDNPLLEDFLRFPGKITISVLPSLSQSRQIARRIHQAGKEVMLHMPMEPNQFESRQIKLMEYEIMTDMTKEKIFYSIEKMLLTVPYAVGINNHQGSRATSHNRTMRSIFEKVSEKNMFFIDSLTSPDSVTASLASHMHIPFATRDVFLDNKNDYGYIKSQMKKLIKVALRKGRAIGIGHINRDNTIKVLHNMFPELSSNKIDLVFASDIVHYFNNKEVN